MAEHLERCGLALNSVAMRYYSDPAFKLGAFESYIGLNEHDTHANVVAMFDHAMDMARADSAPTPEASSP